jgi:hypothetical protein
MITNYLSPLEFQVSIKRLPNVEFFVQKAQIPSLTATGVENPTPFNRTFQVPDKLTYGDFSLSFIIDEAMNNYLEIYSWLTAITGPQSYSQFKNINDSEFGLISDITLLVMNSHKNPNMLIEFKNCFPTTLSSIDLDTTSQDVTYPEATVDFQYDYFTISKAIS